jgi:aquaporin Z
MLEALKSHWPEYLTEACGLAGFIVGASLLTTLLEHPDSPVQHMMGQQPLLRRVPLGIIMVRISPQRFIRRGASEAARTSIRR